MPIQQMMLGAGGDPPVKVQDVFSVDTWTGDGSSEDIDNGINLSGEGGLVWIKNRDSAPSNPSTNNHGHHWFDTVRGNTKYITSSITFNSDPRELTSSNHLTSFNSDGYSVGSNESVNKNNDDIVGWTFRKHSKFFDIQTATVGADDSTYDTTMTHSLECDCGMAVFKSRTNTTSQGYNWIVWHKEGCTGANQYFTLNEYTGRRTGGNTVTYNSSNKTFTFGYPASRAADRLRPGTGAASDVVGYFFADNNNNGEFGSGGDEDIIKTGTYVGNGSSTGTAVSLGFEPQFVMLKMLNPNTYNSWMMFDSTRGVSTGGNDNTLKADSGIVEYTNYNYIKFTSTGFQLESTSHDVNRSGHDYIYVAIRKDQS
jgi:hypothetical protein